MRMPPAVYVGPSVELDVVERLLPGGQPMPPIRRGDLSRDLAIGFGVFLILDGVFFQDLAVSPREIIDVIRAGGVVFGASSMGALRAADCWPAGMRGVGSIYRLFRRGALTSDDEVAVTLSPLPPYAAATVPLINVRYAASRLVRDGRLAPSAADRIVRSASALYFADRSWASIFEGAGIRDDDGRLSALMAEHDLKRLDAIRAVERVSRWLREHPRPPRRKGAPRAPAFAPPPRREASHESIGSARRGVDRKALWQWLVGSGRYRPHAAVALDASGKSGSREKAAARPRSRRRAGSDNGAATDTPGSWGARLGISSRDLAAVSARRPRLAEVAASLAEHDSPAAGAVLAAIAAAGELDGVVLRFIAVTACADWARRLGLAPEPLHRHLAEMEVARAHGFRRWSDLSAELGTVAPIGAWIVRTVDHLALAKRGRQECFAGRLPDERRLFTP